MKKSLLGGLWVASFAVLSAQADEHHAHPHGEGHGASDSAIHLAPLQVKAIPLADDISTFSQPFHLVDEDALLRGGQTSLGATLNGLPGVHTDNFGAGAGRPVIRGQTAPRVSILSDGSSLFDASNLSPDHAISSDVSLLKRVEILRGPATLLYGGGAIGGVVNLLDRRIPEQVPAKTVEGFISARGNTVADEKALAVSLDASVHPSFAVHLERAQSETDDYEIAGFTQQRVPDSFTDNVSQSIGASWFHDSGFIGAAYTWQDNQYGLPGHSHEYEGCTLTPAGQLDCGSGGHHHHHGDGGPWVDLKNRRLDVRGEWWELNDFINTVRLRANRTRYQHHEIEGGQIGTTFLHYGYETRVEVEHAPVGNWHGVWGVQYQDAQFNARGTESFVPKTDKQTIALFGLEHYVFNDRWHLELGGRFEHQSLKPLQDNQQRQSVSHDAFSTSAAVVWGFATDHNASLTFARSQRLPDVQELYANGVHLATNSYECGLMGCAPLGIAGKVNPETSHHLSLNLKRFAGDITFDISGYANWVDDYVFGAVRERLGEFSLLHYQQRDVVFYGAEAEVGYQFHPLFHLAVFGDIVHAQERDNGDELPRIPAKRLGTRLSYERQAWHGDLEISHLYDQRKIAPGENVTPGHTLVNASAEYHPPALENLTVFLRGSNLLAEKIWHHSSFLVGAVPEPGRNLSFGFRWDF